MLKLYFAPGEDKLSNKLLILPPSISSSIALSCQNSLNAKLRKTKGYEELRVRKELTDDGWVYWIHPKNSRLALQSHLLNEESFLLKTLDSLEKGWAANTTDKE